MFKLTLFVYQKQAVYGLTELNRQAVMDARLVANPGCYPTSIQLPLAPLLQVMCCFQVSILSGAVLKACFVMGPNFHTIPCLLHLRTGFILNIGLLRCKATCIGFPVFCRQNLYLRKL